MSLLDELQEFSEGEEPASPGDQALIDRALHDAALLPGKSVWTATLVAGGAVVAVVVGLVLWGRAEPAPVPTDAADAVVADRVQSSPSAPDPAAAGQANERAEPEDTEPEQIEFENTEPESTAPENTAPENTAKAPLVPSLNALLERAQQQRASGQPKQAAATYRLATQHYPTVAAARRALVALAELELNLLGHPRKALRAYERYLAKGEDPVLVQEARYGKIKALRRLGRRDAEIAAIDTFIAAHPDSPYKTALEKRSKELVTPTPPPGLQ